MTDFRTTPAHVCVILIAIIHFYSFAAFGPSTRRVLMRSFAFRAHTFAIFNESSFDKLNQLFYFPSPPHHAEKIVATQMSINSIQCAILRLHISHSWLIRQNHRLDMENSKKQRNSLAHAQLSISNMMIK